MKLIYEKSTKLSFVERLILLIMGEIRLKLWINEDTKKVKFMISTKNLNGEWDEEV